MPDWVGIGGPMARDIAYIVDHDFRSLLMGADPLAGERLWDKMYRQSIHGRKGNTVLAIRRRRLHLVGPAWQGRRNMPVYQLLGGAGADEFPGLRKYARLLAGTGEGARARGGVRGRGLCGAEVVLPRWPDRWPRRDRAQRALVRNVREAGGPDIDIMLDAWSSWDVPYTIMMAERLAEFKPRWIEEPVLADKIDSCAEIRRRSPVPTATGESTNTPAGGSRRCSMRARRT